MIKSKLSITCFIIKGFLSFIFVVAGMTKSPAQTNDIGNWFIYFGNQQINKKWNWWNEVQYRNYNFVGNLEQLLFRTGIGYNLTENNNNLLLGYGLVLSRPYVDGTEERSNTTEHRIYEQFITKQNFGQVFLQHLD